MGQEGGVTYYYYYYYYYYWDYYYTACMITQTRRNFRAQFLENDRVAHLKNG